MNTQQPHKYKSFHLLFLALLIPLTVLGLHLITTFAAESQAQALTVEAVGPNCRYGVTPLGADTVPYVGDLGAGWYLNFTDRSPSMNTGNASAYVPSIRLREKRDSSGRFLGTWYLSVNGNLEGAQAEAYIRNRVAQSPGSLWLIGNEIDRLTQDEITPEVYADAFHSISKWIRETDPTAVVGIASLVEVTPLRLVYLDRIWNAYLQKYNAPIPVDVWNMHIYIIPEVAADGVTPSAASIPVGVSLNQTTAIPKRASGGQAAQCADPNVYCYAEHDNMSIFEQQIRDMRTWMKAHGLQNKPLILSEFSQLWPYEIDGSTCFLQDEYGNCFTPQRVSNFMVNAFNKLENLKDPALGYPLDDNRLVQQWMWFSVYADNPDIAGYVSNLLQKDVNNQYSYTLMGNTFRTYVANQAVHADFVLRNTGGIPAFTDGGGTATATLQARFMNIGNLQVDAPVTVTFYANQALTNPIGSATITADIYGCAIYSYEAAVEWADLTPGTHQYWVKVDATNAFAEPNEQNNIASGFVIIDPIQSFLPLIKQ